jgi:hypothetical protein
MKKFQAVGLICAAVGIFCAATAVSAFAEGEWLAGGTKITTALAADTTGTMFIVFLKSAGGAILVGIECNYLYEGTVGPGSADLYTDIYNLTGEIIGSLGDVNERRLSCIVSETAKELGDCIEIGELAEYLPDNLSLELGATWTTTVELMNTTPMSYLDILPNASGDEVICRTSLGTLENKCEGTTSDSLENMETEKGVLGNFTSESEALNCSLTGEKTGTFEGSNLTTLINGEILSVSE